MPRTVEERTLPIGVEYGGEIHRMLRIRSRLVRDLFAASSDDLFLKDKTSYEVCCLASQIVKLGDIPKESITGNLILDMHEDDFDVLMEAAGVARQRAREFRGEPEKPSEDGSGHAQAGVQTE